MPSTTERLIQLIEAAQALAADQQRSGQGLAGQVAEVLAELTAEVLMLHEQVRALEDAAAPRVPRGRA